jgi:hypothetical protein
VVVKSSKSSAGRLGAAAFWRKFNADFEFQERMRRAWRSKRPDRGKILRAASMGGKALWKKYHSDRSFRAELDAKLRDSRARGGSIALRNLGERGFKSRLRNHAPPQIRPLYVDHNGNHLRSAFEVTVANVLSSHDIRYRVEPRFVVGDHAFYPDFVVNANSKRIIEVVGYMGDRYWNGTAVKIRMIARAYPDVQIAVVTSFVKIMEKKLSSLPQVSLFRPYQEEELVLWCRATAGVREAPEGRVVIARGLTFKDLPSTAFSNTRN